MKKSRFIVLCFVSMIAFLFVSMQVPSTLYAQTPDSETPAIESICDTWELGGQTRGLCNAYCEAMDCDDANPQASEQACERVLTKILNSLPEGMPFPTCQDIDLDGVPNGIDNCPNIANPDQTDTNANGTGDACEHIGIITGAFGVINADIIASDTPSLFSNNIDFGSYLWIEADVSKLSAGAQEIIGDGNPDPSLIADGFSFEILSRTQNALLLKTESEIIYNHASPRLVDYLANIDGLKVGVEVVRAVGYPAGSLSYEAGLELLETKLNEVIESTADVAAEDLWEKPILHIFAYNNEISDNLITAYATLPDETKSDTIVLVTVTDGFDDFLY